MSGVAWTLAVAQMDCATRDTEANLATVARLAGEAASQNVDFAVFPECATTGYFLGEGLAVARIDIAQEDLDRWRAIATYRADRRPELTG